MGNVNIQWENYCFLQAPLLTPHGERERPPQLLEYLSPVAS